MKLMELKGSSIPHLHNSAITFKRILVATDFSTVADKAFAAAVALAEQFEAEIIIANVVFPAMDPGGVNLMGPNVMEAEDTAAHAALRRLALTPAVQQLRHKEVVRFGPVVPALEELIQEFKIDLLVVGTHGSTGLEKMLLGSVAESLIRECSCPVITVGPKAEPTARPFESILFPTALTGESLRANQYAVSLAETLDARITFLHVMEHTVENQELKQEMKRALKDKMRELLPSDAAAWCRPDLKVKYGKPAEQILASAREVDADLIILGAHESKVMADHAPWATLSRLLTNAPCPVMTVRVHLVEQDETDD